MKFGRKFTQEQFIDAVKSSRSIRQTLIKLGVNSKSVKNYTAFKARILDLNLDTGHFSKSGLSYVRGRKNRLELYLMKNCHTISSHNLKLRLIDEKIFKRRCSSCQLTTWRDKLIPLELNHIDGDHFNNEITNLELLCPNCHAFTPKYRGRGRKMKTCAYSTSEAVRKILRFGKT